MASYGNLTWIIGCVHLPNFWCRALGLGLKCVHCLRRWSNLAPNKIQRTALRSRLAHVFYVGRWPHDLLYLSFWFPGSLWEGNISGSLWADILQVSYRCVRFSSKASPFRWLLSYLRRWSAVRWLWRLFVPLSVLRASWWLTYKIRKCLHIYLQRSYWCHIPGGLTSGIQRPSYCRSTRWFLHMIQHQYRRTWSVLRR